MVLQTLLALERAGPQALEGQVGFPQREGRYGGVPPSGRARTGDSRVSYSMVELPIHPFRGRDGASLVFRETGQGRPLLLIHGFFSTATTNWVRFGHAAMLAARSHRVIMPDLRGHGESARPHDAAAYPPDVLADDGFALIEHLGLAGYDLGGYSLGGRVVIRMLARGALPGRAIAAGMGLEDILHTAGQGAFFRHLLTHLGTFAHGTKEWEAEAFLKTVGGDPLALLQVLETSVDTPREVLERITTPILVLAGIDDQRSTRELAAALPNGQYAVIPGSHMGAVTKPQLGAAIADFLDGGPSDPGALGPT